MIQKICPCLSWLFTKNQPTRKGYSYSPRTQLQQEQFMHKSQLDTKSADIGNQLMSQQITPQQQLSHNINLTQKYQTQQQQKQTILHHQQPQQTKQPQQSYPNQQKQQQQNQPYSYQQQQQLQQKQQQKQPQNIKSYGFKNLGQLQLNIPQYGADYQLLKQKSHNIAQLLDISLDCTQVSLNSKQKINKTKLRVWRKSSNNCFVVEYQLPCSYSFYNQFMNRRIQPKQNNKLVKEYRLLESIHQNLTLRYLCMNKIGMLQSREFTYLKFTNNSSTNPSGHWELCVSKSLENQSVSSPIAVKPGKLFTVSYIIQDKTPDNKVGIRVRTYLCLDIGVTVEKVWERILNQTKTYIQQLWEEAASEYIDQLV